MALLNTPMEYWKEKASRMDDALELKRKGGLVEALERYQKIYSEIIADASKYAHSIPGTFIDENETRTIMPSLLVESENFMKSTSVACYLMNNMGTVYAELQDYESATNAFEQSIQLTPDGMEYNDPKIGLRSVKEIQKENQEK